MGTRSNIGYKNDADEYVFVYCHWDGYIENNGHILKENYDSYEKVKELVDQGDMSYLSKRCDGGEGHSFESPLKDQTVYYSRDRGPGPYLPRITKHKDSILETGYAYVFINGIWYVKSEYYDLPWLEVGFAEKVIDIINGNDGD